MVCSFVVTARQKARSCGFVLLPLVFLGLLGGCSSTWLVSRWSNENIPVDGQGTSWHDSLVVLDDKLTSVGILNDERFLYVNIVSTNKDLERNLVERGLTFWFDRDGGEQKKFGVRFPLGVDRFGGRGGFRRGAEPRPYRQGDSIYVPVNDVEILGPDPGAQERVAIDKAGGIDARFQVSHDTLTYTLKVPISSSGYFPHTIGANPGAIVGITIESTNTVGGTRSAEESGSAGGRGGGGGIGGRGGYGGRGGSGGAGFGRGRPGSGAQGKPFSQFVKVKLADQSSSTVR